MKCPVDNETLVMTERSGVEIDYCPKCRGVWLDRGELDKIIDHSRPAAAMQSTAPAAAPSPRPQFNAQNSIFGGKSQGKKKKDSFLGELFDF